MHTKKHLAPIIKLERRLLAVESQPHRSCNPPLFYPPFVFVGRECVRAFLSSSSFFFPPLPLFFLHRVLLGTCEWQPMGGLSPLSLSASSLTSTARSDAARLRRAVEVEQRATKAAVNGYTWLRRAPSQAWENFLPRINFIIR